MSSVVTPVDHGPQMITFVEIDIHAVHESKHNPRRHFDEEKLRQLADNIAHVGILTPLLVRPDPQSTPTQPSYEIAAGHRRYRAAKLAKMILIPCLVREMSDQEFAEALNIENLQREGLHPLDEAQGYEALRAAPYKLDVKTIAAKVGRQETYIYDRLKLLNLTKEAQAFFWDGKIEAGHAIVLARLTPSEQAKVIGAKAGHYLNGGLFQEEHDLYDEKPGDEEPIKARSVAEVQAWIKRHIRFNAKQADTFLFPETVAQVAEATEDKRKIIEITREYLANEDVRRASADRVYGERAWKRADGKEGSKVCERSVLGVIASGTGQGEAFTVCINKDRCLVHWGADVKAKQRTAKLKPDSPAAKASAEREAQARKKEQEQQEQRDARRTQWAKMTPKIEAAVMAQVKVLSAASVSVLGDLLVKSMDRYGRKQKIAVLRGKTSEDLVRYLAALVLADDLAEWNASEQFPATAKALGVDLSPFVKLEAVKKKGKAA